MPETKLNRKLIEKMIKRLEEKPETYLQSKFYVKMDEFMAEASERPVPACGAAACLAGEAIICDAPTVEEGIANLQSLINERHDEGLTHVAREAAERMGLDLPITVSSLSIFDSCPRDCWPAPFGKQFKYAETYREEATVAVGLLRAILRTDGKILEANEAPIIEQPVLCTRCSDVLVEAMPEDERDEMIEALRGDKLKIVYGEIYHTECAPDDPVEDRYRRSDEEFDEWRDS